MEILPILEKTRYKTPARPATYSPLTCPQWTGVFLLEVCQSGDTESYLDYASFPSIFHIKFIHLKYLKGQRPAREDGERTILPVLMNGY